MKRQLLRLGPWVGLMILGIVATPRFAGTTPPPERHPHIRAAIHELGEARQELQTADHDFCGHRAEALEKTDQAIKQLHEAMECDRR